ncbi:MAG: calcium/sodium antiporter [Candidatus Anammoximicrobium sp.]|nr:calcium/sodium antiporter [Candidatus Anammoximicrobium sp.]
MTESLIPLGLILAGLLALGAGGELLVRGASKLAAAARITPLVVGLTVVAFGTSSPELAVSLDASLAGQTDIAVGNVVGSNIMNILFILGISALVSPLTVSSQLIRLDVPLMIGASVLMLVLSSDGNIGRGDGGLLFGILVCYIVWTVWQSRRETSEARRQFEQEYAVPERVSRRQVVRQIGLVLAGLVLLTLGAECLVDGATAIARLLGMSELLIGLTIVALGTSLPEVAASVLATWRGERDIAVGNVIGSNLFNILCVLGLSAAVSPQGIAVSAAALRFDIPVMIAVATVCLPIFFTGQRIARWEGGLFLGYYVAYTVYLVLSETDPAMSRTLGKVMWTAVLPLTAMTLLLSLCGALRHRRA